MNKSSSFLLIALIFTSSIAFSQSNPFSLEKDYQIKMVGSSQTDRNSFSEFSKDEQATVENDKDGYTISPMSDNLITFRDLTSICYESYSREGVSSQLPKHFEKISSIKDEESGFQALSCIDKRTGKMVVSFTGTQPFDGMGDLIADLGIVESGLNNLKKLILKKNRFEDKIIKIADKIAQLEKDGKSIKAAWFKSKRKLFELYLKRISRKIGKERKAEVKNLEKSRGSTNIILDRQVKLARKFLKSSTEKYNQIKPNNKESNIVLTGHSLGGFLAQIVGTETGHTTYTFNAPGAEGYLPKLKESKNIFNYIRESDIVGNFGNHIGEVNIIKDLNSKNKLSPDFLYKNHDIEGFANQF